MGNAVHTLRNVLLVLGLLAVLGRGGCLAILAVAVDSADNSSNWL